MVYAYAIDDSIIRTPDRRVQTDTNLHRVASKSPNGERRGTASGKSETSSKKVWYSELTSIPFESEIAMCFPDLAQNNTSC